MLFQWGCKTLIMGKRKYSFGYTEEVLTEKILSEYYELRVSIKSMNEYKCLVFEDERNYDGVKIVF